MADIKKIEGRAYGRGYAAGRFRAQADLDRELARERDRIRWDAYFCAALQGTMVNAQWQTGDKKWTTTDDYVKGCVSIADAAMKHARFKP